MEIRHLRYFLAVAEELSFSRAARMLHIAQPPLSQQIRQLERELGTQLFERTSRSVRLTSAGDALVSEAHAIISRTDVIRSRVYAAGGGETGSLSLGCVPAGFAGLMGSIIRPFMTRYPAVQMAVRELNTRAQYDAIETGELDLGLVRTGIESPKLAARKFYDEHIVLALPTGHRLEDAAEIELADLADDEFVFFSRKVGKWHFDQLVQICQNSGFSPTIAHECDSILAQLSMVASGLGIALVTELTTHLRVPGVVYRPISESAARIPLLAVWSADLSNPVRDNLLRALENWSPEDVGLS